MTRYFYTDPLAAAYMERRHGVMFVTTHTWSIDSAIEDDDSTGKFYIHPDSLSILQPQEGDLIDASTGAERYAFYYRAGRLAESDKIIQRNDKPFFTPESEDCGLIARQEVFAEELLRIKHDVGVLKTKVFALEHKGVEE